MRRQDYLRPLLADRPERVGRDRLEILTALIGGPSFDPVYRADIIKIPGGHPIYRWECVVARLRAAPHGRVGPVPHHQGQWAAQSAQRRRHGRVRGRCLRAGTAGRDGGVRLPDLREAARRASELRLCQRHLSRWAYHQQSQGEDADFAEWVSQEHPFDGYGAVRRRCLPEPGRVAAGPVSLARQPLPPRRQPGRRPHCQRAGGSDMSEHGKPVPVGYADKAAFRRWCATVPAQPWPGQVNLRGLRPLVRAEIQWGLFVHTQRARPTRWDLGWIRVTGNHLPRAGG